MQRLLVGPQESRVMLAIENGAGDVRRLELARGTADPVREPRPESVAELQPGVLYLDLERMTDDDFRAALPRLTTARGLILDLRGYPRVSPLPLAHLIDEPITCARWNIPVAFRPDRQGVTFRFSNWPVAPIAPRLRAPVVCLTGPGAISYAETFLGMVEHYRLAAIVGQSTAGTNGNVNRFTIPGGYSVSFTGMKVLKHDGSRHHGVGIQPTVPLMRTRGGARAERDELLEKALEMVGAARSE
jgi:C-terminal processing protease CtpA/Prc